MKLQRTSPHPLRITLISLTALVLVAAPFAAIRYSNNAYALGGLSFSELATHPQAAAQSTTRGKTLTDLEIQDGILYAGYGDYEANTGPIEINPFDISGGDFTGSVLSIPTEEAMVIRSIGGNLYVPMTDPQLGWTVDVGFATNQGGTWVNRYEAPAVHVFDVATLSGSDLWMVGSAEDPQNIGAIAYRSTDGGATWTVVRTAGTPQEGYARYYWAAAIGGKMYLQAQGTADTNLQIFDGTSWTTSALNVCQATDSGRVVVFDDKIVCASEWANTVNVFDGTTVQSATLSMLSSRLNDLYVADDGYLYGVADGGVVRSTDGLTWEQLSNSMGGASIAVAGDYVYIGTTDAKLYRSTTTIAAMTPITPTLSDCFTRSGGTITGYLASYLGTPCERNIVIPSEISGTPITAIAANAFYNKQLTGVTIPSSVTSIGNYAFYQNQITSIVVPSSVTSVGTMAFANNLLTSINFEGNPTTLGWGSVNGNILTTIGYNGTAYTPQSTVDSRCFTTSGGTITGYSLYDVTTIKDSGYACMEREVDIPSEVSGTPITAIGSSAFMQKRLTRVTIPESVTTIGGSAFQYNNFAHVTIPSSVTRIEDYTFRDGLLESVTLPAGLTYIGDSAFQNNRLENLVVPNAVTAIAGNAFSNNRIESLTLSSSLLTIGNYAFANNQIQGVTLPNSVTSIGFSSFTNNQIAQLTLSSSLTTIPPNAFYTNKLTGFTIPSSITSIGSSAFYDNLLTSIAIPSSVTSLGTYAFQQNRLASVTLSNGLTSVGAGVFSNNNLSAVTLPASITSIDSSAFAFQGPSSSWNILSSADQAVQTAAYESLRYIRMTLENPAAQANIRSQYVTEAGLYIDVDRDGFMTTPVSGYIVGARPLTIEYVNRKGETIRSATTVTGQTGSDVRNTYLVVDGPDVSAIEAAGYNATDKANAMEALLNSSYYQDGDTVQANAIAVTGFITPTTDTQTLTLGPALSMARFTYTQQVSQVPFVNQSVEDGAVASPRIPEGTSALVVQSVLSMPEDSGATITEATLLSGDSVTSPEGITILGGVGFTIESPVGETVEVSYTLGGLVDAADLRVYKRVGSSLVEITNLVTISVRDGKTVITYAVTDGGVLDEDGVANGVIVDPLYVGTVERAVVVAPAASSVVTITTEDTSVSDTEPVVDNSTETTQESEVTDTTVSDTEKESNYSWLWVLGVSLAAMLGALVVFARRRSSE